MSTLNGGPGIVTEGLSLYLDAANPASCTSGSTVWNDLSRSNIVSSIISDSAYTSSYNGAIFSGNVSGYVNTNYTLPSTGFTISLPYVCTSYSAWAGIWACEVWNNSSGYLAYFETATVLRFTTGGSSAGGIIVNTPSNVLQHYTFTLSGSTAASIYINGILATSGNLSSTPAIEKSVLLSTRYNNAGTSITDRKASIIPLVQIYNRPLTAQEVLQNYTTHKSRFGL